MCALLSCAISGVSCLDVTASGSHWRGEEKKKDKGRGRRRKSGGGAKCYVALRQVAASQRVLKVRRMSSQPLRLLLCCFTSTEKSNKNDKCVG